MMLRPTTTAATTTTRSRLTLTLTLTTSLRLSLSLTRRLMHGRTGPGRHGHGRRRHGEGRRHAGVAVGPAPPAAAALVEAAAAGMVMSAGPCVGSCAAGVGVGGARGACFRGGGGGGVVTARYSGRGRGRGRGRRCVLPVLGGARGGTGIVEAVTSAAAEASDSSSGRPAGIDHGSRPAGQRSSVVRPAAGAGAIVNLRSGHGRDVCACVGAIIYCACDGRRRGAAAMAAAGAAAGTAAGTAAAAARPPGRSNGMGRGGTITSSSNISGIAASGTPDGGGPQTDGRSVRDVGTSVGSAASGRLAGRIAAVVAGAAVRVGAAGGRRRAGIAGVAVCLGLLLRVHLELGKQLELPRSEHQRLPEQALHRRARCCCCCCCHRCRCCKSR